MAHKAEITFYRHTGYSINDEPANDAVIDANQHWVMAQLVRVKNPSSIQVLPVSLSDADAPTVDYIKVREIDNDKRWYYYVLDYQRINEAVMRLTVALDAFASVGMDNLSFFGNIVRRSLADAEKANYPLLPEPWAPRRPLRVRRVVIDTNVNKTVKLPSHVALAFEQETTIVDDEGKGKINVPNSPLLLTTTPDQLQIHTELPMVYPNPAENTTHEIVTPWGEIRYDTPFEQYYTLGGNALAQFLALAKKTNAMDMVSPPYYLPAPAANQHVTISELSRADIKNDKANRWYTTITIRALAGGAARTFGDTDINMEYEQSLTIVIAPDKNGGIYVLPTTMRDRGLNEYTYLEGVYSPFESMVYNAIGDTPGKFAADGTVTLNTALANLFLDYANKINSLQFEGMQQKYFKEMVSMLQSPMAFASTLLANVATTVTTTEEYQQVTDITTNVPPVTQTNTTNQTVPRLSTTSTGTNTTPANTNTNTSTTVTPPTRTHTTGRSYETNGEYTATRTDAEPNNGYIYAYTDFDGHTGVVNHHNDVYADTDRVTSTTSGNASNPRLTQEVSSTNTTPEHNIRSTSTNTTAGYTQPARQVSNIPQQITRSTTTQEGAEQSIAEGVQLAKDNIPGVVQPNDGSGVVTWQNLTDILFRAYKNEVHTFMLGNINDYLNRWTSLQNDIHNGKHANLFKNVTLIGGYQDSNKVAGKYEIVIASLQPEDARNFDMFLEHFGHAVDEYSDTLVRDVRPNYNYTMVGDDAIVVNSVKQGLNGQILNQFRTGVRVWKTKISAANY